MKRTAALIAVTLALSALALASCAPKIIGPRPHRRDRHCGCENKTPDTCRTQQFLLTEHSNH